MLPDTTARSSIRKHRRKMRKGTGGTLQCLERHGFGILPSARGWYGRLRQEVACGLATKTDLRYRVTSVGGHETPRKPLVDEGSGAILQSKDCSPDDHESTTRTVRLRPIYS